MDRDIHVHHYFEHAATFEGISVRLGEIANDLAEQGCIISSVSHTIDREDPDGPYQFIVVGRSIDARAGAHSEWRPGPHARSHPRPSRSLRLPCWFTEGLQGPGSWGPDLTAEQMRGADVAEAWLG